MKTPQMKMIGNDNCTCKNLIVTDPIFTMTLDRPVHLIIWGPSMAYSRYLKLVLHQTIYILMLWKLFVD